MSKSQQVLSNSLLIYTKSQGKLKTEAEIQTYLSFLQDELSDHQKSLNDVFSEVETNLVKIIDDLEDMLKIETYLDFCKEESLLMLNKAKEDYDETVQKRMLSVNSRKAELKSKLDALAAVQNELDVMKTTLKQKQATVAELGKEMQRQETCLVKEASAILSAFTSESEANRLKSMEKLATLHANYVKMTELVSSQKAENEMIRKDISIQSKQLAAFKAENVLKLAETATLHSKIVDYKAEYARKERKNQQILNEIRSGEQKLFDDVARLNQQVREQRIACDNLKKTEDHLTNRICLQFGKSKSIKEMVKEAKAELMALNQNCSELESSINGAQELIVSNENELKRLTEEHSKLLKLNDTTSSSTTKDGLLNHEREEILRPPLPRLPERRSTRKTKRRHSPQDETDSSNQSMEIAIGSADSTVSEEARLPVDNNRLFNMLKSFQKHHL